MVTAIRHANAGLREYRTGSDCDILRSTTDTDLVLFPCRHKYSNRLNLTQGELSDATDPDILGPLLLECFPAPVGAASMDLASSHGGAVLSSSGLCDQPLRAVRSSLK